MQDNHWSWRQEEALQYAGRSKIRQDVQQEIWLNRSYKPMGLWTYEPIDQERKMIDELILLEGTGGKNMATSSWYSIYNPRTGTYNRRRRKRKTSSLGSLELGQASTLKGTLGSVKGVLFTGAIAAGGAIATDALFDKVESSLNLTVAGYQKELLKMAFGIGIGIAIAKVLKKPRIAAAFAIGPVVSSAMRIFADVMGGTTEGLISVSPMHQYPRTLGRLGQITQVGPGTPSWMMNPSGKLPVYNLPG